MEKNYNTLRKTHFLRSKNKNEMDSEDVRLSAQKGPLRDKYCQTDHDHHGCCDTVQTLEPGDPPLLQKPMQTARSGILQIIECFRSGTKQLKQMLLKEVDTIFECKSCRSLFRGLPNLITHKQFYCLSKLHVEECPSAENDKPAQEMKDLLETIYPRADKSELVIQLEPIQTNKNAVFQFVTTAAEIGTGNCNPPDPGEIQMPETTSSTSISAPQTEVNELPPSANCKKEPSSSIPVESPVQTLSFVPKSVNTGSSHPFSCRVCKKNFTCRRGIRRHIKKVHRKKLEDIKKFIEVQRMPTLSKGRKRAHTTSSKSCHMCQKSFATKANVRRHIDEVHKGLRRDSSVPEGTAKPEKKLATEIASSKKSTKRLSRTQKPSGKSDFSLSSCKCPYCKRRYASRYLLKKHVHIVHKAMVSAKDSKQDKERNHAAHADVKVKIESSSTIEPSPITVSNLSDSEKGGHSANEKKITAATQKSKIKPAADSLKASPNNKKKFKKPKLSAGFDFKQLFCKLCKRQFTSKQNLAKHIELHTDGNTIYVKFYRCPLCSYETRRKRDVIRHITVVHKKSQRALVKITGNLESRAIKKPIEIVLDKVVKNAPQKEKSKQLTLKPDGSSPSPNKKHNTGETSIEVKVTKSFSLLKCNKCGKAFAKKTDLDQHKKDHIANSNSLPMDSKTKGRSTRSKTLI